MSVIVVILREQNCHVSSYVKQCLSAIFEIHFARRDTRFRFLYSCLFKPRNQSTSQAAAWLTLCLLLVRF